MPNPTGRSLTALERETHISFNDEDECAIVTTHIRTTITTLRKNSGAVELGTDAFGGVSFRIPKKLVSFRNVRKASAMSPEARKAAADRLARGRAKQ